MAGQLADDGTMDTVICCDICGEEARYNYSTSSELYEDNELTDEARYQQFVEWAISDFDEGHVCENEEA